MRSNGWRNADQSLKEGSDGLIIFNQHNQGSFGRLYAVPGSESTPEPFFVDFKFSPHGQQLLVKLEARLVRRSRITLRSLKTGMAGFRNLRCPGSMFQVECEFPVKVLLLSSAGMWSGEGDGA
jgi:hypothetical protein